MLEWAAAVWPEAGSSKIGGLLLPIHLVFDTAYAMSAREECCVRLKPFLFAAHTLAAKKVRSLGFGNPAAICRSFSSDHWPILGALPGVIQRCADQRAATLLPGIGSSALLRSA